MNFDYSQNIDSNTFYKGLKAKRNKSQKQIKNFVHNKENLNPTQRFQKAHKLFNFCEGNTSNEFYSTLQWYLVRDFGLYERIHTKLKKNKSEIESLSLEKLEKLIRNYTLDHMNYKFRGKEYLNVLGHIDEGELIVKTKKEHTKDHGITFTFDFKKQSEQIVVDKKENKLMATRAIEVTSDYLKELDPEYSGLYISMFLGDDLHSPIKALSDFHQEILRKTSFIDQQSIINRRDTLTIDQRISLVGKIKYWIENDKEKGFLGKNDFENYMKSITPNETKKYREQTLREFYSGDKDPFVMSFNVLEKTESKEEENEPEIINEKQENFIQAYAVLNPALDKSGKEYFKKGVKAIKIDQTRLILGIPESRNTKGGFIIISLEGDSEPVYYSNQTLLFKRIINNEFIYGKHGCCSVLVLLDDITKKINTEENQKKLAKFLKCCRFIFRSTKEFKFKNLASKTEGKNYLCDKFRNLSIPRIKNLTKINVFDEKFINLAKKSIRKIKYQAPFNTFCENHVVFQNIYNSKKYPKIKSIFQFVSDLIKKRTNRKSNTKISKEKDLQNVKTKKNSLTPYSSPAPKNKKILKIQNEDFMSNENITEVSSNLNIALITSEIEKDEQIKEKTQRATETIMKELRKGRINETEAIKYLKKINAI